MSIVIHDGMPNLSVEELEVYSTLSTREQRAFLVVRDTSQCATARLEEARILPDAALKLIGNVCARTVLLARGK